MYVSLNNGLCLYPLSCAAGLALKTLQHWNTSMRQPISSLHLTLALSGNFLHMQEGIYISMPSWSMLLTIITNPLHAFRIDESHRPVRLRRVVLGYPSSSSDFKFNLSLNYRIGAVIHTYSDQKPSLVVGTCGVLMMCTSPLIPQFCATRKGTQQAAATLVKDTRFVMNSDHKRRSVLIIDTC